MDRLDGEGLRSVAQQLVEGFFVKSTRLKEVSGIQKEEALRVASAVVRSPLLGGNESGSAE